MTHYSTKAFILHKQISEEKDNIYHFFTQDFGKVKLFAKSTRDILAKLAGHLEPPTLVDITFSSGERPRLLSALEDNSYFNIKNNGLALNTALKISELVDDLTIIYQPDDNLFQLIFQVFYFLDNNLGKSSKIIDFSWLYFEAHLLRILGYEPFLEGCVVCGIKDTHYFSFRERGLVCLKHKHADDMPLTNNQKKYLRALFRLPLHKFTSLPLISQILEEKKFLEEVLGKFTLKVKSDIM
ncbi:MAG: DNA repair protein RecO [Parcubacteria group bacterium]|nr:DNA repair protein RecO [Parcubacteria group bacterium]